MCQRFESRFALAALVHCSWQEAASSFFALDEGVNELDHELLLTSGQDSRRLKREL